MSRRVALCTHFSVEHFRGGEKWVADVANRLAADGVDVDVYALPYAPGGERRVDARDVLDDGVGYTEGWRHDVSGYDTAYVMYTPGMGLCFSISSGTRTIAGIHSWAFITDKLFESHYGVAPTAAKLCYRLVGANELRRYDVVHAVSRVFDSPHPETTYVPNFVDTTRFRPGRAPLHEEFTVLVTAAHIREKGWDVVQQVADRLPADVRLATTGECSHPHIDALGFLDEDELADAYAAAHLVLHPTRVDTDSMVINEALASGTPVISSPLPTHVRTDEAAMHANSASEIVDRITDLAEEFRTDRARYDARCALARQHGRNRDAELVYRRLRRLLFPDWIPDSADATDPTEPTTVTGVTTDTGDAAPDTPTHALGNGDGQTSHEGTTTQ
ncbi:glycosyl transferase group 1 [Salinigranum rubrum]|uniref:Glycosyl transferase group 1 n=1 Tax=Salinigranum rubrum TaxID=755307 RepID=A0A2I8VI75_9EURY|nr:glycosyltransferase family 4 protein [Salinigranum rubrum]AUV81610.1 glycosyl transferase group 1 [Salinigranum rubrum]